MLKIVFLGTRGYIKAQKRRHKMHTATLFSYKNKSVLIDCGETWKDKITKVRPQHIVITHAHPDHAFGLSEKITVPIWASQETWKLLEKFPIPSRLRKIISLRKPTKIAHLLFEAFPVVHSIKAPAVGYRITAGNISLFYVPDVVWIPDRKEAFKDISVYIGDGATIERNMIRRDKKTGQIFGHANIKQQFSWCKKEDVKKMIITHCGSDIVANDERKIAAKIRKLSQEYDIESWIAFDGMEINLIPKK